jgi:hypothetical protein
MAPKRCFVIMPIGNQVFGDVSVTAADLKQRYDDLIKEAIQKADQSLEIMRADEVPFPGVFADSILTPLYKEKPIRF